MKYRSSLAWLIALAFAITSFAFAQTAPAPSATKTHAGKTGHLKLTIPMQVGEIRLPAGDYEVKDVKSSAGHFVQFGRTIENDFAPEGMSVYEQQIVATVPSRDVRLDSQARHTELLSGSNGRITGLKIRGENVEHVLGESAIRIAGTPSPQR